MPKLSQADTDARKSHILEAAHRCLGERGFSRTTMRDIARQANLSLGGVYSHFGSKRELMRELAREGREKTGTLLKPSEGPELPALVDSLVRKLEAKDCLEGVRVDVRLWGEALHTPELKKLVLEAFANAKAPLVEAAKRAQSRRRISRKLSPDSIGRVFLGTFLGLAVQKAFDPKMDAGECARVMAYLLR